MRNKRRKSKLKQIIKNYLIVNKKQYIIITLLFVIGIFFGVLCINNIKEEQFTNVSNYVGGFIEKLKQIENVDFLKLLKTSILQNFYLALSLFFFGTTVVGLPVVFGIIIYRGFCLGYTISSCVAVLGTGKGLAFISSSLLLQNIILIPAMISIAVSGMKLYKLIIKDKRRENIKVEIIRHLLFCTLMTIILIIASLVEIFISNNILINIVKYL